MKGESLICPITQEEKDKLRALNEVDNFASYLELPKKEAIQMRLLAEELLGMTEVAVEVKDGKFWIEGVKDGYEMHLSAKATISYRSEEVLVKASSGHENSAYKGMTGKLRQVIDIMTDPRNPVSLDTGYSQTQEMGLMPGFHFSEDYSQWSYSGFHEEQKRNEIIDNWDGMECSILGHLADDIIVFVRNNTVEIVIKKNCKAGE